ncbi:MAG TPA: hypothetical protein VIM65_24570 [Cyclobacteriaceae bacterium]
MIRYSKNVASIAILALSICLISCKDGDNGPGFNEAVKYGDIKVIFSGRRPVDSVNFSSTIDYKYGLASNTPYYYSSVTIDTTTDVKSITIARYFSGISEHRNQNYFALQLEVTNDTISNYYIETNTTISTDSKFFGVNEDTYKSDEVSSISDFSYNTETGKLKLKFTWTQPTSNSTSYDLKMEGVVNVTVLEALNNLSGGE